jgi:hypothetical protein
MFSVGHVLYVFIDVQLAGNHPMTLVQNKILCKSVCHKQMEL